MPAISLLIVFFTDVVVSGRRCTLRCGSPLSTIVNGYMVKMRVDKTHLPIHDVRQQVLELVYYNDTSILMGETGCGKSTQVPQICLDLNLDLTIAVTQPRRVAAISLATRVAEEMGTEVGGDKVGYRVRFENQSLPSTRVVYMTDGILLRDAMNDGLLSNYSLIIVDEAHERSLHTDILLYIIRLAQKQRKEMGIHPLKTIIMSATVQSDLFSSYFNNAPVYLIKGRTFPVDLFYAEALDGDSADYVYNAIVSILQVHAMEPVSDDILVFMTGREEIEMASKRLRDANKNLDKKMVVYPLYAALDTTQQQKVFKPAPEGVRKVILSTNIAETSLTIPGIRIVVDCGKVKQKSFNANDRVEVLRVESISKAQAAQRAGRAGRESSGKCYRLYSSKDFEKMQQNTIAEILRSNLAAVILELVAIGMRKLHKLKLIEQPDTELLTSAERQLKALGALKPSEAGKPLALTKIGKLMSAFPVEPEYSKVLLAASELGCLEEALTVVSLLSGEEIFLNDSVEESAEVARRKVSSNEGDHVSMLAVYKMYRQEKKSSGNTSRPIYTWASSCGFNLRSLTHATKVRTQLRDICKQKNLRFESCGVDKERIRKALALGLFMNACEWDKEKECYRMIVTPSITVRIHPSSVLARTRPSCIVFSQLLRTTQLYAKDVSVIDRAWINDVIREYKRKI